jgi:hypothetical protein
MENNKECMKNIEDNLKNIINGYLEQFINKFDNFSNQIKIADILLKAYDYRYNKIIGKIDNVNDIIEFNNKNHEEFEIKCEKLPFLQTKLIDIEDRLKALNNRVDSLLKNENINK